MNGIFDSQKVLGANVVFNKGPIIVAKDLDVEGGTKMYMDDLRLFDSSVDESMVQALTGGAFGALGSVSPNNVRLGCLGAAGAASGMKTCNLDDAKAGCPRQFHLCTVKELYSGALMVVRAMGWFHYGGSVWPGGAKQTGRKAQSKRLAVCCRDEWASLTAG